MGEKDASLLELSEFQYLDYPKMVEHLTTLAEQMEKNKIGLVLNVFMAPDDKAKEQWKAEIEKANVALGKLSYQINEIKGIIHKLGKPGG